MMSNIAGSSNGRNADSESVNLGSTPSPAAKAGSQHFMRKSRKNFKILTDNLLYGYRLLCLNEVLHKKVGAGKSTYYDNFKEVWDEILVSLEILYLLELAKVFDDYKSKKRSRKIISIHDFFSNYKPEFKGYLDDIKKVIKIRHETIAHTNQNAARNLKGFFEKLGWKHAYARPLFEKTIDALNRFATLNKLETNLKSRFEETNLHIQKEAERFVGYSDQEGLVS